MGKVTTFYCDICGRKIEKARYRATVSSCNAHCKKHITSKTFAVCEDCLLKVFKNADDEEGEEE